LLEGRKTGGQQVPWELSSLEGQFYFSPGKSVKSDTAANEELDDENQKLEAEQHRLEKQKVAFEKQKALDEKRQQIAEGKGRLEAEKAITLAIAPRPYASSANEIKRDGRFIAYDDGTVLDTKTKLMWAAKDNGSDINWQGAMNYCENYSGGGYTDWRMPTQDELARLYDPAKNYKSDCGLFGNTVHLTELIRLTCSWAWTSETRKYGAVFFDFKVADWYVYPQSDVSGFRALPVRSVK
jgi:hypothetical protein